MHPALSPVLIFHGDGHRGIDISPSADGRVASQCPRGVAVPNQDDDSWRLTIDPSTRGV